MKKTGISETKWLFAIIIISSVIPRGIGVIIANQGTGAWISVALSLFLALAVVLLVKRVFMQKDIFFVFQEVYGTRICRLFMLSLFAITVFKAGSVMKNLANAAKDTFLTESPLVFVLLLLTGGILTTALLKLEAITRYAKLTAYSVLALVFVIYVSLTKEMKILNLYPILGRLDITGIFNPLYIFSPVIYFYVVLPHIQNPGEALSIPLKAVLAGGGFAFVLTVVYTLCVPYPMSAEFPYPLQRLSLLAGNTVVFQRTDGFVFVIWMFVTFVSAGAVALFAVMIFSKTLELKNQNAICPAVALLCFGVSLIASDYSRLSDGILCVFTFVIMPVTGMVYQIKRRIKYA